MFSRPVRRRIIIVISALASLVAVDRWVRRAEPALRTYDVAVYEKTINSLLSRGVPNIVLMGSSRAKYALMPAEFEAATGKAAYNVAIPGSKVVEWQLMARRLFAEQRPELVVLGINASELRADYVPATAARHLFTFEDLRNYVTRDHLSGEVVGNYLRQRLGPTWATYDRRYELKMWCQERLAAVLPKYAQEARELRERATKPGPPDGYDHPWLRGRQLRNLDDKLAAAEAQVVRASTPLFSPDATAFGRLGDLLEWFQSRRIRVFVVYIPNSPETESRWREVEPRMIEMIASICRTHGVPFLPCTQADVPRENRDFIEEIHVGLPLARRISSRIAGQINVLGLVSPDSRRLAGAGEMQGEAP